MINMCVCGLSLEMWSIKGAMKMQLYSWASAPISWLVFALSEIISNKE